MKSKSIFGIIFSLLLITTLGLAFYIQPTKSEFVSSVLYKSPEIEWIKTYGESAIFSVQQTMDGGYILAAGIWLIKVDSYGNVQWSKTYSGAAHAVLQTEDGGYVLAGDIVAGPYNQDGWIAKVDSMGNEIWSKSYDGEDYENFLCIRQTSDGGYILAGIKVEFIALNEAWIVKVDANGTIQWEKTFGGSGWNDRVFSIIETSDDGYAAVGWTWSYGSGETDAWLIKLDSNGNLQWHKTYGGAKSDGAFSIQENKYGEYILAGYTESFSTNGRDVWLIKTNAAGDMLWNQTYGVAFDTGKLVQITNDGGYILVAITSPSEEAPVNEDDVLLIRTNASGAVMWDKIISVGEYDIPFALQTTTDGGYLVGGYTGLSGRGWLIKLGPDPKTWIVDDDGPADFHTIQEAINAASLGDIIFVKTGTFYENVIVNKSVSIIGESRETTLIDGNGTAEAVIIAANNTMLSGFTIQSGSSFIVAVRLENVSHVIITNNTIRNSFSGLTVAFSDFNTIADNNITRNTFRDTFINSSNNILRNNMMEGLYISKSINNTLMGNTIGSFILSCSPNTTLQNNNFSVFGVYGETLSHFVQDIDSSNTVNGKPVYYWVNCENSEIPSDAGYVALINCINITVRGLNFENNFQSIIMFSTNNSQVLSNNVAHVNEGIWLSSSYNNLIYQNNIIHSCIQLVNGCSNNFIYGNNITAGSIRFSRSSSNNIFHNNFINAVVDSYRSTNTWNSDYPSGGNFWSGYVGFDEKSGQHQDLPRSDGIGDTPHAIDANNTDRYPLMAPFITFDVGTWNGESYNVDVVSNSTVSDFRLDVAQKTLSFNVTGIEGQAGFCRVTIPNIVVQDLWQGNYTVLLNGEPWSFRNWTDITNTYIYLNYTHSKNEITIIPEFSSTIILLFMLTTLIATTLLTKKRKRNANL